MTALPPISSFAFRDILRAASADSSEFQLAIDGIAELCAKNRMSLADEYASHLPPLGEITASNHTMTSRPQLRPGSRRALTSVPEASSGSSEGSRKSKKQSGIFGFRRKEEGPRDQPRRIRIGSMGRTVILDPSTALDVSAEPATSPRRIHPIDSPNATVTGGRPSGRQRSNSEATISLQRLLLTGRSDQPG